MIRFVSLDELARLRKSELIRKLADRDYPALIKHGHVERRRLQEVERMEWWRRLRELARADRLKLDAGHTSGTAWASIAGRRRGAGRPRNPNRLTPEQLQREAEQDPAA